MFKHGDIVSLSPSHTKYIVLLDEKGCFLCAGLEYGSNHFDVRNFSVSFKWPDELDGQKVHLHGSSCAFPIQILWMMLATTGAGKKTA